MNKQEAAREKRLKHHYFIYAGNPRMLCGLPYKNLIFNEIKYVTCKKCLKKLKHLK